MLRSRSVYGFESYDMNAMNMRRAAILVIVLAALAVWIAAAATSGVRDVKPIAALAPAAIDASGAALAAEIARLHDRLRPTTTPTGGRDLFQFASARPQTSLPAAAAVQAPAPAPPPAPLLAFIGLAEDTAPSGVVRTAVISAPGQLFLVKEGDEVTSGGARYRVVRIAADSLKLAAADETILRLALK